MILPYAVGGGGDAVLRTLTDPLGKTLGQPIYMDYKAGAGGTIGLDAVAHSAPDGYTIGIGSSDAVAMAPNLFPKLNYDPRKDLKPIAIVAEMPLVLMVKADSPHQTLQDLLKDAKAQPRAISSGTPRPGSSPHLMGELLGRSAGVRLVHVPYKGTAPAIIDLFGSSVSCVIVSGFDSVPLQKAGRVRTLAVTGSARYPLLASTPTRPRSASRVSPASTTLLSGSASWAPAQSPRPSSTSLQRRSLPL